MITHPNEINAALLPATELALDLERQLIDRIKEASDDGRMEDVQVYAGQVTKLRKAASHLKVLEKESEESLSLLGAFTDIRERDPVTGLRNLEIEVTEGMVNQSLLTLTEAKKRGEVQVGEKFTVHLPDGTHFTSELTEPGNKLRERSSIRRFYTSAKVADGDKVSLVEFKSGHWRLMRSDSPEAIEANQKSLERLRKTYGL